MKEARAQVHFHKGETASCIISVTSSGKEAIADELLLWSCFAVRQLNNMGRDAPTLASLLANVAEGLEQLANHDGQGPKLLNQHRATARKRFEAALVPYRDGFRFRLRMKGFGILGRGLGYYCPLSALLLLRHMAKRRRGEPRYMACLEKLAAITGGAFLAGYINMRNGNERAHQHVSAVLSELGLLGEAHQSEPALIHPGTSTGSQRLDPGDENDLDSLTSMLAQAFAEVREVYYSGCVKGVLAMNVPRKKVQMRLTRDGHFVVGSFQMWLTFNVLDWKREKYLAPSVVQKFVDQMYWKLLAPHLPEGSAPETADKGVLRFDGLAREGQYKPYEEFWYRMREIIFDGTCDIGGYRRSSAALGLDIGLAEDVGIRTAVGHMDIYLTRATQLVLANAFGDDEFAAEQSKALQQLANG